MLEVQAAQNLGAGGWRLFRTITLPLMLPGILAGGIVAFAASLGEFGAVITFASNIPGETQTLPLTQELLEGKLDVLLLALPLMQAEIETMPLFDDRFLLALPQSRRLSSRVRATRDLIEHERLLLLEEAADGVDDASYWIACNNFYVLTRYNRSRLYAAAVFELAVALKAARGNG